MNRHLILGTALAAALATTSCANMDSSQQSTLSGAAIGAGAGYLTDQERQRQAAAQQKAFDAGVQAGKQQSQKN